MRNNRTQMMGVGHKDVKML